MEREIIILSSALKRKFRAEDIAAAVEYSLASELLPTGERLYIGIINNVLVEMLGRHSNNGDLVVYHCMKCRKKYLYILESYYER